MDRQAEEEYYNGTDRQKETGGKGLLERNIQAKIDIQERNEGKKYCKGSERQERSTIKVQTDRKGVL